MCEGSEEAINDEEGTFDDVHDEVEGHDEGREQGLDDVAEEASPQGVEEPLHQVAHNLDDLFEGLAKGGQLHDPPEHELEELHDGVHAVSYQMVEPEPHVLF